MSENIAKLVNGYVREWHTNMIYNNGNTWIPRIVIHTIKLFYNIRNITPSMVFQCNNYPNNFKEISGNNLSTINVVLNHCSEYFIQQDYSIYIRGENRNNQFGNIGTPIPNVIKLPKINGKEINVKFTSHGMANKHHCFVYTIKDELYQYGYNSSEVFGIDGSKIRRSNPILIKYKFDSSLIQIECGRNFTLFLTLKGTVYGCGYNNNGQLTRELEISKEHNITLIKSLKKIQCIGCAEQTSYAMNKDGVLFTFGDNANGALGIGRFKIPQSINTIKNFKVDTFSVGSNHISCIQNGISFNFGLNNYGQCGVDNWFEYLNLPNRKSIKNIHLNDVKCGGFHTIVSGKSDEYYAFGKNNNSQCLHDNSGRLFVPRKIDIESLKNGLNTNNIIDIIPGFENTFILCPINLV